MKATRKVVASVLNNVSMTILTNLITDLLQAEEEQSWRGPVIQELIEGERKFYEPKDIDTAVIASMLSKEDMVKDKHIVEGSVTILRVFNTQNEIKAQYNVEGEDWTHQYCISIDDYLKAKENA